MAAYVDMSPRWSAALWYVTDMVSSMLGWHRDGQQREKNEREGAHARGSAGRPPGTVLRGAVSMMVRYATLVRYAKGAIVNGI